MKANREFPRAYVSPKAEKACRAGHPWVYDAEIERLEPPAGIASADAAAADGPVGAGSRAGASAGAGAQRGRTGDPLSTSAAAGIANGSLVDVLTRKGGYLGTGILSLSSKIRIRLISTNANDAFDAAFWERKIRWAWNYRKAVLGGDASCCRLVFSEADGFCGLIVDRFEDALVTQTLAFGMERLKPVIFPLLVKVLAEDGVRIRGIYERNDVNARTLEGLQQTCGWYPLPNAAGATGAGAGCGAAAGASAGGAGGAGTGCDADAAVGCGAGAGAGRGADAIGNVSRETFPAADAADSPSDIGPAPAGGLAPACGPSPADRPIPSGGPTPAGSPLSAGGPTCAGGPRAVLPRFADVPAPLAADDPRAAAYGPTSVLISENGVRYRVDFEHGQKTGFFLDQKYNRRAVGALAGGRHVLDCFTHTGSFALNAALGGAEHVHAVDVSQPAIDAAQENARLNGPDVVARMTFQAANVFDLLPQLEAAHGRDPRGGRYDLIILDPPAFTKSRRTVDSASRGYHEINQRALRILPRGGYLATCSCSHFMDTGRFRGMLASAAQGAGVQLRQIAERQQAPDHPILWGVPETDYLKFFLFQVV